MPIIFVFFISFNININYIYFEIVMFEINSHFEILDCNFESYYKGSKAFYSFMIRMLSNTVTGVNVYQLFTSKKWV